MKRSSYSIWSSERKSKSLSLASRDSCEFFEEMKKAYSSNSSISMKSFLEVSLCPGIDSFAMDNCGVYGERFRLGRFYKVKNKKTIEVAFPDGVRKTYKVTTTDNVKEIVWHLQRTLSFIDQENKNKHLNLIKRLEECIARMPNGQRLVSAESRLLTLKCLVHGAVDIRLYWRPAERYGKFMSRLGALRSMLPQDCEAFKICDNFLRNVDRNSPKQQDILPQQKCSLQIPWQAGYARPSSRAQKPVSAVGYSK